MLGTSCSRLLSSSDTLALMSRDNHKKFVMEGEAYKDFTPKEQEAEYSDFFDTFWDYNESKHGMGDQGSILGGWQDYKKKLTDQIGKKSGCMVSISIMSFFFPCIGPYCAL